MIVYQGFIWRKIARVGRRAGALFSRVETIERTCLAMIGAATLAAVSPAAAATYSVLYQFGSDAKYPENLVVLPSGSLAGSAFAGADAHQVIYKLDPPPSGKTAWDYSVIYDTKNFLVANQAFSDPNTFLTDQAGNIYGRSDAGPQIDAGTIYRLSPPASGKGSWTCTILYHRYNLHGFNVSPERLVYIDHTARHIYGLSYDWNESGSTSASVLGEQMFRLDLPDPPAAATLNIVSPIIVKEPEGRNYVSALIPAQGGVFYGAIDEYGQDAIFRVTPPTPGAAQGTVQKIGMPTALGGNEVEPSSISVDKSGRLVGLGTDTSNQQFGEVFEFLPPSAPGGAWKGKGVYTFLDYGFAPTSILNHNGLFYGTFLNDGVGLFQLAAPVAGSTSSRWSARTLHSFGLTSTDGGGPCTLVPFKTPNGIYQIYGVTRGGGSAGSGTIFRYTP